MENFQHVQQGTAKSVVEQMSKSATDLAAKNRQVLTSIMECMKFCIAHGLAVRGHRDDGLPPLTDDSYNDEDSEDSLLNLGNFKSLVLFRAMTDDILRAHLVNRSSNYALYISHTAQADMMKVMLMSLQHDIIAEATDQVGKFIYALSADEVTDASNTEQLAIVLRTAGRGGIVHERLLEYIDLESLTGLSVSRAIVDCLSRHDINITDCRAQTYDGAGNMAGRFNGCQAHIKSLQPLADYYHCSSHRLNLALNATSKVQEFRILMENIKKLGIFYKYSPKRSGNLSDKLANANPKVSVTKVRF